MFLSKQMPLSKNSHLNFGVYYILRRTFSRKLTEFNPDHPPRDKPCVEPKAPCEPQPPKCPPETPTKQKRKQDKMLPDPSEIMTGKEKSEFYALQTNPDPYNNDPVRRMKTSSESCPNLLKSINCERIVGCICEEDQYQPFYWIIYAGKPTRCMCGHWFELVQVPKVVEEFTDEPDCEE